MRHDHLFVKLDFTNAFNSLRQDVMLRSVYEHTPELYTLIYQSYAVPSNLQFGAFSIKSELGPQQGDPVEPLLFCQPLQSTLCSLQSQLKISYLDGLTLRGSQKAVTNGLNKIKELKASLESSLN